MATRKSYAYQVKGNKISLLENQFGYGSGQDVITVDGSSVNHKQYTLDEIGPTGKPSWVSPTVDVTDGIEIEYAYSPSYSILSQGAVQINKFYISGWVVKDGYLTFIKSHATQNINWGASPWSAAAADEYILVKGSIRWDGLHKIKAGSTNGILQTYTKVSKETAIVTGSSNIDIAAESGGLSYINANNSSNIFLNQIFSAGSYIYITGSSNALNNQLWEIDSVADASSTEENSGIYVKNKYYTSSGVDLDSEQLDTTPNTSAQSNESTVIYEAYRDFSYILTDISVLEDESYVIDLPPYLSKALVYYVKAKFAEDQMEIEKKEYFMREFKKLVEKHESSKISGPRKIMGFGMTR